MDDREDNAFQNELEELGAKVEVKRLTLGDFICSERTVIERKTRSDFESSILDKRIFHQLTNLKENFENIIVIIEGTSNESRIDRRALLGAYTSLITNFHAGVFFTKNIESTAELIHAIAKHEQLSVKSPFQIKSKRKTHNLSQIQRSILESFPMVGSKLAKTLLEEFKNLENIINSKEEDLLKIDKLGKKKAKAIRNTIENDYDSEEDHL